MPDLFLIQDQYSIAEKYLFTITRYTSSTHISMTCMNSAVNTDEIPHLMQYLTKEFPSVLYTKCFNDLNLPFETEVKNTEVAHLFEHLLIEHICKLKIQNGAKSACIRGLTKWNWRKDPYGTFKIFISVGKNDKLVFDEAFYRTVLLFDLLTSSRNINERQIVGSQPSVFLRQA